MTRDTGLQGREVVHVQNILCIVVALAVTQTFTVAAGCVCRRGIGGGVQPSPFWATRKRIQTQTLDRPWHSRRAVRRDDWGLEA